ncbi:hypothetical protein [Rhodopirellula bahusiensis]|uniref:hypothetical protein n=1 Tax=Rhodopirellula bahusiensis TaxID=2014065 RepID=UPI003264D004
MPPSDSLRNQAKQRSPGIAAKRVGFRAAADVLQLVLDMLGTDLKVPSHDAIEQWTLRLGVASLKDTFTKKDRVLWMADHSSQIGKERLLLIVGVALDDLPPPGQTLSFDKIKVLALVPGQSWKKGDVEREYLKLAKKIGAPIYLLCDGARELRDPADKLEKDGEKTIVLGDLKHHAANVLEKEIGRSERFKSFVSEVGLTRNRVQQTELDQFAPPTLKSKSRFMNVGTLFKWAMMVLYHLDHPSDSKQGISDEPMEQKFGWLRQYADDLRRWKQCQAVIEQSLRVINSMGLDEHTPKLVEEALNELNPGWRQETSSATRIGTKLIDWIEQSAIQLQAGQRAWLSTEILESLFGRFKQMERQHSKGGFTRLIAAIPTLCMRVTGERIREAFGQVDSKATWAWIQNTLGKTLTARRNASFREYRSKTRDHELSPT